MKSYRTWYTCLSQVWSSRKDRCLGPDQYRLSPCQLRCLSPCFRARVFRLMCWQLWRSLRRPDDPEVSLGAVYTSLQSTGLRAGLCGPCLRVPAPPSEEEEEGEAE